MGRIGQALAEIETEPPRLTRRRGDWCAGGDRRVSPSACWQSLLYGLLRGSWLEALLAGIALDMSMLPEEFPLVLSRLHGDGRVADFRGPAC